jgi:hypothetical protein
MEVSGKVIKKGIDMEEDGVYRQYETRVGSLVYFGTYTIRPDPY